jgi:uracil phosphoribosyltransferase
MITVIDHPLVQHKLTLLRKKETTTGDFRRLCREISLLMGYEVLRDLPLEPINIETPLEEMEAFQVSGKKLCFISVLRAGAGILDGILDLVPAARIGHVGLYRDPISHEPVEYYFKVPDDLPSRLVVVVDPMLATGHSAAAAVSKLKEAGAAAIKFVCLISGCPDVCRRG